MDDRVSANHSKEKFKNSPRTHKATFKMQAWIAGIKNKYEVKNLDGTSNMESEWWLPSRALVMMGEEQTRLRNFRLTCHTFIIHIRLSLMSAIDVYDVFDVEDGAGVCKSNAYDVFGRIWLTQCPSFSSSMR